MNQDNSILFGWVCGWLGGSVGQWVGSGQMTNNWINLDLIKIIQFCLMIYDLLRHPHPWVGVWWLGGSVGQWVGSGQMTKNWINLDIIEIIQFCLKIYDLLRHPYPWVGVWVVGLVSGSMGGVRWNDEQLNESWHNWDNSILFDDLWLVETPPPMGGCVGGWVVQWVNGWGQVKWLTIE